MSMQCRWICSQDASPPTKGVIPGHAVGGWPRLALSRHVRLGIKFGCPVLAWLGRAIDGRAPCLASETWAVLLVILRNIAGASTLCLGSNTIYRERYATTGGNLESEIPTARRDHSRRAVGILHASTPAYAAVLSAIFFSTACRINRPVLSATTIRIHPRRVTRLE